MSTRKVHEHVAKDGTVSYKVRFKHGVNPKTGKPVEKSETFYDERTATEFAGVLKALGPRGALAWLEKEQAEADDDQLTLDEWGPRHIDALTSVTDGTRGEYRRMYEVEWSKRIGYLPMAAIDREMVQRAVRDLAENGNGGKGYAEKTLRNYHGLLSAMFDTAALNGHIGANPSKGIKLPRRGEHEREEHRYLSHAEFRQLLEAVPARSQPVVMFLAGTGCRWSEMSALSVRDLNLKAGTVLLRKSDKWARGKVERTVGPTKTRRSRRTVTLPRQVVTVLRPLVSDLTAEDRVFRAPRGGKLHQGSFWTRVWEPTLEAAELDNPQPRIHDLRHTHASWLIAAGRPLPEIQRRLGHESIQTTVDTYGHLAPDQMRAAADAAEIAMGEPVELAGPEKPAIESSPDPERSTGGQS